MRRLPRTIDKPTELLGFRMDEIGVFVSVLLVFLLVDWFFATVLVIVLSAFLVGMAIRPKPVVVVPGAAVAGVYNAGEMPETVMVQFARNFVVDLANYTPASAEKGYLSAARFMSPELLSRFEPVAREQLKQVVTNRGLSVLHR